MMGTFQGLSPQHPQCHPRFSLGEAVTTLSHSLAGLAFQQCRYLQGSCAQSKPHLREVSVQKSSKDAWRVAAHTPRTKHIYAFPNPVIKPCHMTSQKSEFKQNKCRDLRLYLSGNGNVVSTREKVTTSLSSTVFPLRAAPGPGC